jgi:hypothetical protein
MINRGLKWTRMVYIIIFQKKKDLIYKRSKIEGNCVIKSTSRSPVKSSSSASRKKKYSVPLNRKKMNTIRNKPYNTI